MSALRSCFTSPSTTATGPRAPTYGVEVRGVRDYHAELLAKAYKNNRPGIERPEWGGTEFTVIDPVNQSDHLRGSRRNREQVITLCLRSVWRISGRAPHSSQLASQPPRLVPYPDELRRPKLSQAFTLTASAP